MFYSHPNKLLKEHLKEVSERSKDYFKFNFEDDFTDVSKIIGLTHDFGKYSTYFQKKLKDEETEKQYSDHSLISSLFTYYVLNKVLNLMNLSTNLKEYIPLISLFVVLHHHKDLRSLDYVEGVLEENSNIEKIKKQIDDICKNRVEIESELKELNLNWVNIEEFENSIDDLIKEIKHKIIKYTVELQDNELKIEAFFLTLALFSSLIDSDKKSASQIRDFEGVYIPPDIVDNYKKIKFQKVEDSFINKLREEIYRKVIDTVEKLDLKDRIYTFTSPTGSGKTLTSLSFALKLRDRIKRELNYQPRIIYSLPFISIIDQNFKEIENFLSLIEDYRKNRSKYLIAHHHLSSTKYEIEDEDYDIEKSILLIESWDSEIIVTTFVQLLETIIGFKNRFLKKYHNISNSIILLDEVQNIPIEYWDLIELIFYYLTKYLNTYIVLLTATRPLIFRNLIKPKELLINHEYYFSKFERVKIYQRFDIQNIDNLIEFIEELYKNYNSLMVVLNTINSSIDVYKYLKDRKITENIIYLSANITPKQRLERIKTIKDYIEQGKKFIVVSTQVIEAGVDINLDCVIRDIGPFDSIVQVSGRCNREFKKNLGDVFVVFLQDEKNNMPYSVYVYKKLAPMISYDILKNSKEIYEKEFLNYINLYFNEILMRKSHDFSKNIINSLLDLIFYDEHLKSISEFRLINDLFTIPVFIELDDYAKEIFYKFKNVVEDANLKPWEKKLKILDFNNDFQSYIVNVRINEKNLPLTILFERNLGYVKNDELEKYYDLETGFKKQGGIEYII